MTKHKVLVADDHPDSADLLSEFLKFHGHEVRCAYNGGQAIDIAKAFKPNVAVLDINMPIADGYEVARTLRATRDGRQFIIAMTGASSAETREKAKAAGFDLHLVKPIDLDDLTALLETFHTQ